MIKRATRIRYFGGRSSTMSRKRKKKNKISLGFPDRQFKKIVVAPELRNHS